MRATTDSEKLGWTAAWLVGGLIAVAVCGCASRSAALRSQNAALLERNRAMNGHVETLAQHVRELRDQLSRSEKELARLTDEHVLQATLGSANQ